MSRTDRETPRSIAVFGVVMLLLTVLGYVGLGIVMKMNGYPESDVTIRWTRMALSLRQHGHWFILVPVLWVVCAVTIFHLERGTLSELLAGVAGGVLLFVIPMLFLWAIMNPYTRPLLMKIRPENAQQSPAQAPGSATPRQASHSRN